MVRLPNIPQQIEAFRHDSRQAEYAARREKDIGAARAYEAKLAADLGRKRRNPKRKKNGQAEA